MLSELQRQKWPRLFHMYDTNQDGRLEFQDFERLLHAYTAVRQWQPGDPGYLALETRFVVRWQHMLKHGDANGNDYVTLDEWLAYMGQAINDPPSYQVELQGVANMVFGIFDLDGDGRLGLDEYAMFFRTSGLDEKWAQRMFDRLCYPSDATVSLAEFTRLFDQFFQGQDAEAPGNWVFGE